MSYECAGVGILKAYGSLAEERSERIYRCADCTTGIAGKINYKVFDFWIKN